MGLPKGFIELLKKKEKMPFPKNWTEELISEYLELEGYFVRTNIPLSPKRVGGRGELDILGIKVEDKRPKIIHIETGILSRLRDVERKFNPSTMKEIRKIAREFGFKKPHLEHWFVYGSWTRGRGKGWKNLQRKLEQRGVVCMTLGEMFQRVSEAINLWKEKHKGKIAKQTLPGNLWLLKMQEAQAVCVPPTTTRRKAKSRSTVARRGWSPST